jgi:hypothetical protein
MICPKCTQEFDPGKQRRKFCSRSCANTRVHSPETKAKISNSIAAFLATDEGNAHKKNAAARAKQMFDIISSDPIKWNDRNLKIKLSFTETRRSEYAERARNRIVTDAMKTRMSEIAKQRQFGGHTSKRKLHFAKKDGSIVYLQSGFEIRFAELLETNNIEWTRPDPLIWTDGVGKDHRYYPDFKVGNIYIDTKNDYLVVKDADKIRKVIEQNNIDLRVVTEQQITQDYVIALIKELMPK